MSKKKLTAAQLKKRAEREECGVHLIDAMVTTFTNAYKAAKAGESLEGLLIEVDIMAVGTEIPADVHFAMRHATKSAVNAVAHEIPLAVSLSVLGKELSRRLELLLEET